ncbi:MAG TPA: TerC family protein [Anaerolineales bacterium]|nr:TerC family protein [Anaerolineales bacterium]
MEWLTDPQIWISLITLTALEIVLGIDNIIFISILASRLPTSQQEKARRVGLALAMITRILLLLSLAWLTRLETTLFGLFGHDFTWRDVILIGGGLFLLAKSTFEIHEKLEGEEGRVTEKVGPSFTSVIIQIIILDIIFSLDSVITAVGMANLVGVMIAAVVIAVGIMMVAAGPISDFVNRRPTVKMLALSFLLLVGVSLVAEGAGFHIPKGYIYFAIAFSVFVEVLNLRLRPPVEEPVKLRTAYVEEGK